MVPLQTDPLISRHKIGYFSEILQISITEQGSIEKRLTALSRDFPRMRLAKLTGWRYDHKVKIPDNSSPLALTCASGNED